MASSQNFIEFVCDQIRCAGNVSYKKMFGEYMIYCDGKAALLVCDDTVFVKKIPETEQKFREYGVTPDIGFPYPGAREHYVLDIENSELAIDMTRMLAVVLPAPKPKKPKVKQNGKS